MSLTNISDMKKNNNLQNTSIIFQIGQIYFKTKNRNFVKKMD